MQFAFYKLYQPLGNINDSQATNKNHEQRENLSVRASLEIVCIYTFQNSYFFQCLSWYLWILSACWLATLLLCAFCAVYLLIMTWHWHYKRPLNASQTVGRNNDMDLHYRRPHRNTILCMRASRSSEENFRISAFNTCYLFHYFCWYFRYFVGYNMTFNREMLGGGGW